MKKVVNCYYVHKSNLQELLDAITNEDDKRHLNLALRILNECFDWHNYDVIKYDKGSHKVSFIQCPTFDTMNEPEVEDSCVIDLNTAKMKFCSGRKTNKQIYHSKELFVAPDYTGFDLEKARARTEQWNAIPNLDKSRIGNKDFWVKTLTANGMEV